MPLFELSCPFCEHRFDGLVSTTSASVRCPLCLSMVARHSEPRPGTALEVQARRLGAAHGLRARDGDDLDQYTAQYDDEAALTLLTDIWSDRLPEYRVLAAAAGPDWLALEPRVFEHYREGFLAGCEG